MTLYELQKKFLHTLQNPDENDLSMQIYHDSSMGGRFKALRNVFPCCEKIVGESFFWQMAMEFLKQPSTYLTADAQGEQFPHFISEYKAAVSVPYLTDLAKLEWLWYQVFHGLEGEAGAKILTSHYPVTQLWEMCQPEYKGDFVLRTLNEPLKIMIVQRQQRIHMLYL